MVGQELGVASGSTGARHRAEGPVAPVPWRDRWVAAGSAIRDRWWAALSSPDRQVLFFVTAAALVCYTFAARVRFVSNVIAGDEPHYLVFNIALQKYHSLNVIPVYDNRDYWPIYSAPLEPHMVAGPSGPLPLHGFGGPLLWHLPYLLFGRAGALGFIVVISALTVANIFLFLRELGITRRYAGLVALLFAVGSPLYVLSSMLFVDPIAALFVLYAVRVALGPRLAGWRLGLASLGLGVLPWVHGRFLMLALPVLALLAWRVYRTQGLRFGARYVWVVAPIGVLVLGLVAFNAVTWHSLNPAPGNAAYGAGVFQIPVWEGFFGLTLDRSFGLLTNFPLLVLVFAGVALVARRALLGVNVALGIVVVPYVAAVSTFEMWWAGYSPPARLIACITPLLSYYVAVVLQRLHHWLAVFLAGLFALGSLAVGVTTDLLPVHRYVQSRDVNTAFAQLGAPLRIGTRWQSLLPSVFPPLDAVRIGVWVVLIAAFTALLWLLARRGSAERIPVPAGQFVREELVTWRRRETAQRG